MYPQVFNKVIEIVLKHEGGFQCNPADLGNYVNGELRGTKYGIAARYFPELDIKNLTIEEAKKVYYEKYWIPMNLLGLNSEDVILEIFDMGVNAGRSNAIRIAQKIAKVNPDGKLGPVSNKAINSMPTFLSLYKQARLEYYNRISKVRNNKVFLQGWTNRVLSTHF